MGVKDTNDRVSGLEAKALQSRSVSKPCGSSKVLRKEKARAFTKLIVSTDALVRHKKWLKEIQDQKAATTIALEEDSKLKSERKRKFKMNQARKRKEYREGVLMHYECDGNIDAHQQEMKESKTDPDFITKPGWALTESSAHDKRLTEETVEEEGLLSFIESLDLESIYRDIEVNLLVNHLKERIRTLEANKKWNQENIQLLSAREADFDQGQEPIIIKDRMVPSPHPTNETDTTMQLHDVSSIAASVMTERPGKALLSIHSRKSMTRLVFQSHQRFENKQPDESKIRIEAEQQAPITVNHKDDNGARIAETKNLNKLPFKNRNPAV